MPERSPKKPDLPKKESDHQPQKSWVSTAEMASWLSMHEKTLLKYLRDQRSPFQETRDFRRLSLSNKGPVQWHLNNAENTFSTFKRIDPSSVETYGADADNGLKDSKKADRQEFLIDPPSNSPESPNSPNPLNNWEVEQ